MSMFHDMPEDPSKERDGTKGRHRASRPMIRRAGLETLTGFHEDRRISRRDMIGLPKTILAFCIQYMRKCATAEELGHNRDRFGTIQKGLGWKVSIELESEPGTDAPSRIDLELPLISRLDSACDLTIPLPSKEDIA
ncbi:hypothetical protein AAE478_002250 [Parahypoxylon ruwenzoriense]